ncbi:reverse transcriptase domain-containing protein [Tanacetum coccineum]|uniref:Reverse transcriptase domain-containing protein n=1 Tax=Tanacetum coccineum TaxID=301880 RepID=A0ABQ4ZDF5_9ASTR
MYTSNCGCSKGSLGDKILVPIPDSSQRSFKIENFCLNCGDPIHGFHCQRCALIQKTFEEVLQDFQDTSESSDDNTNVVNAPREPIGSRIRNPGENSLTNFLHTLTICCHSGGDSLDGNLLPTMHLKVLWERVPPKLGDPGSFLIPCNFNKTFSCNALADLGASINIMPYSLYAKLSLETLKPTKMSVRLADRSFQYPIGIAKNMLVEVGKFTFPADFIILKMEEDSKVPLIWGDPFFTLLMHIDVIDEILEEDFDALLDEGSKILHFIEGTILEEEIFSEFDKFIAMVSNENYDSESDQEEPKFEKITINTDCKVKTSLEEPPTDLELKLLLNNLEYVFLEETSFLHVIISSQLSAKDKSKLVSILKRHKEAFAWKTIDILVIQKQRRLNTNMQEAVKKEIVKLLDTGIIYPIVNSPWVSPIHCVPKKGGITVVTNKNDELVPTRTITGWRVCINYRKLNEATAKDHFPFPFIDQMLERLARNKYFCFLDGFSGYFQIPIDPMDQEKATFTCPFGTYAYRRMPFGLCNVVATFQRCMLAIFHDMIEEFVEVFMDDFSIFGNSFEKCLNILDKMLQRCKDAHLVLNWEKCHFMVKEGILLGHKVFGVGLEVDKAKIDVISKLPPPTNIKGVRTFLGHAGFYRRFIKDFSKIARPITKLLEKDTTFEFNDECQNAFELLKEKFTCAPVIVSPNWNLPFELMCDASDFAVGAILDGKTFIVNGHRLKLYYEEEDYNHMMQTLEDIMRACVINFGGSYHSIIRCAPFEALYGRKCRSPILWEEIKESSLTGLELVQETTDKIVLVKEKPKAVRDHQKSYVDYRCKPLEFRESRYVYVYKVTPWKGVVRFGKKGKLAPRYVGPFEILERIDPVAYSLRLPEVMNDVVTQLKVFDEFPRRRGNVHGVGCLFLLRVVMLLCTLVWASEVVTILRMLKLGRTASETVGLLLEYVLVFSLLLTPLCCDDIRDVTPRVSA